MANLIDRNTVLDTISNVMSNNNIKHNHRMLNQDIKQIPVALTNTERHAHWIGDFKSNVKRVDICSCCKWAFYRDSNSDKYAYCPNCGAKMDEVIEDEID